MRLFTPKSPPKLVVFSVNLPETMIEELDLHCQELEMKRVELIRQMVQHCLDDLVTMTIEIGGEDEPKRDS